MTTMTTDETKTNSTTPMMTGFYVSKPGDTHGAVRDDIPIPTPGKNEAKIKVLRAGVCNTDLEILQGYMGFTGVLGHEFVGIVVEVNVDGDSDSDEAEAKAKAIKDRWMGKRVCGDINVGCSSCRVCTNPPLCDRNGAGKCPQYSRNHCPTRSVLGILNKHGTMAEYLTLPIRNLHEVPAHVSDEVAVFAEPLAAACRIVEQNLVRYLDDNDDKNDKNNNSRVPPDKVAILGDGKLGLMIAEVLGREHTMRLGSNNGNDKYPKPVLFGKHPHKLNLVQETAGVVCKSVTECIDETPTSFTGVSKDHEHWYDVVIDATGSPAGLKLAAGMCRPMGTLVLKSTCAAGVEQFNAAPFVIDELRVVGSRCGPIDRALELLAITDTTTADATTDDDADADTADTGKKSKINIRPLNVEKYVTKTFPLSEAVAAIQCAAERSTMKVQIVMNE